MTKLRLSPLLGKYKKLNEMEFRNQKEFDAYRKAHKLRSATKIKIAGKSTTAGQAASTASTGKPKGTSVFGKTTTPAKKTSGISKQIKSAHDFDTDKLTRLTKGKYEFDTDWDDDYDNPVLSIIDSDSNEVTHNVIPTKIKGHYKLVSINGPRNQDVYISSQQELEKAMNQLKN